MLRILAFASFALFGSAIAWALFSQTNSSQEGGPLRIRLFDLMEHAKIEGLSGGASEESEVQTTTWSLDDEAPQGAIFASPRGRGYTYEEDISSKAAIAADTGLKGGSLRLGPGVESDRGYLGVAVDAKPLTRYRIYGRVRLENNPMKDEASSREVFRVVERNQSAAELDLQRSPRRWTGLHRVSRTLDPSGWDRFEASFLSLADTQGLELRLYHRTGESAEATTSFDEIVIEEKEVSEKEIYDFYASRFKPRDGQEAQTPWRLRVPLNVGAGDRSSRAEYRDAILLPPPGKITFPVHLPESASKPRLRFMYGMLPDVFSLKGDGAEVHVTFADENGAQTALANFSFDPKQNREDRAWKPALVDLSSVAGQKGSLTFETKDLTGSDPDVLDAVVIATPRVEPTDSEPVGYNVLMIGVDTLRADHLSAFGYDRDTTPNLKKLADSGVRFNETRCQAPWTLPSFSTIFTSLYPSAHGAGRGGHDEWTPIDPTTTSLAEILSRIGYETQGVTANHLISPSYGLDQGFESYRVPSRGFSMESVATDTDGVVEFLDTHANTPFFLFWHIMDPHLPYSTGKEDREKFTDTEYNGQFNRGRRGPSVPFQVLDPRPGRRWFTHEGPPPKPDLTADDEKFISDYYDAEIYEVDRGIGAVLDKLETLGLSENTVVAFVADHGEGLGDHNHYHHGYTLFDDQVHIPMILRIPGKHEGKVIDRPVGAIDLAPTILGALGLPIPETFEGVDRLAENAPSDDPIILEYPTYDSSAMKAYIQGPLKYLHDPVFHKEELYDTQADPLETTNILEEHPEFVATARKTLDEFRWTQLQKGRYHMRVLGKPGQRLQVSIKTDDLFDANFVTQPLIDEHAFEMDLGRTELKLDTILESGRVEFVFWCRGNNLDFSVELDGKSLRKGLVLGTEGTKVRLPSPLKANRIPTHKSDEVGAPARDQALLWLEAGASQTMPVVPTPEEIEMLRQLGYAR